MELITKEIEVVGGRGRRTKREMDRGRKGVGNASERDGINNQGGMGQVW